MTKKPALFRSKNPSSSPHKALEKVREAGGAVVAEPKHVGEMGIYARVKDSEGNVVGVWEDLKGKK